MYIMLLNLVHQLKWETNSILYLLGPTFTFSSGDVLGPLSERLPWAPKFYYPPLAIPLSIISEFLQWKWCSCRTKENVHG